MRRPELKGRGTAALPEEPEYDARRAADYWGSARHEAADELNAVLSFGEPPSVNEAYDRWESTLLLDSIRPHAPRLALDVGCGVGRMAVRLAPGMRRVLCGDVAAGMLERVRVHARGASASNIDPIRLRSDRLPFADGSMDLVLCLGLLEHLPDAVRSATLRETARVLAKGGILALTVNNGQSLFLEDEGDNPHRIGVQEESGYYCALVDERALLDEASPLFEDTVLGSNLFYSLQRHAARRLAWKERSAPALRAFFDEAARWDVALKTAGPLPRAAADHHLHLLVRRSPESVRR